jgi:hypothetical protein
LVALLSLAVPAVVWASGQSDLAEIRAATARYHRFEVAEADGFVPLFDCIDHATEGAMGFHYILPSRFDDQLRLSEPEVLLYEQHKNGKKKLVGVEYVIPAPAWSGSEPPTFLGQELKFKTTVGQYPVDDPYYEVHVWTWRNNPNGMFADWNPTVTCPEN